MGLIGVSAIAVQLPKLINSCFNAFFMQKRYYLDTSIWLDFFEDRQDNIRPLGEFAFQFLKKCLENKAVLFYSKMVLKELGCSDAVFKEMFLDFGSLLVQVQISIAQLDEAELLSKRRSIPAGDALHAILARDNNAVLITRDKHFDLLFDIADSKAPEQVVLD